MKKYLVRVTAMWDREVIAEDEDDAIQAAEEEAMLEGVSPTDIASSEVLEERAVDKEDLYEG